MLNLRNIYVKNDIKDRQNTYYGYIIAFCSIQFVTVTIILWFYELWFQFKMVYNIWLKAIYKRLLQNPYGHASEHSSRLHACSLRNCTHIPTTPLFLFSTPFHSPKRNFSFRSELHADFRWQILQYK